MPVLVWEASYSHAANLLAKLHPDLPPYLDTLRVNAVRKAEDAVMQSPLTPTALPIIDVRYPVAPFELIQTMSVITSSLLASQVHQVLLRYIANDNPEIFAYMLDRSPVFRGYPSDFDRVDYRTWSASICLGLLDQNWRFFAGMAGKVEDKGYSTTGNWNAGPSKVVSTSPNSSYASLSSSASRWASTSCSGTNLPRHRSFPGTYTSSNSAASFQAQKIPLLATALSSTQNDVARWSLPRWKVFIEDLEGLLCRRGLLQKDGRDFVQAHVDAWKQNVDYWKACSAQMPQKPG